MTLLDIIELYNINNGKDLDDIGAIFEDIELDERLDKDVLAGVLLDECGAMTSIYNVTSTFKYFSNLFFKKYKWNIKKLVDTLEFEYDPLKNRQLEWTETSDIQQNLVTDEGVSESRTKGNTGTQTNTLDEKIEGTYTDEVKDEFSEEDSKSETDRTTTTETKVTDFDSTETNTVSAMNSNNYLPDTKREVSSDTTEDTDGSENKSISVAGEKSSTDEKKSEGSDTKETDATSIRTDNLTESIAAQTDRDKNEDLDWDETDTHEESGTVNTDYQSLIEKERKVAQFSIYSWIAKKYAKELFLLVY